MIAVGSCKGCGNDFVLGPRQKRRLYCTDRCKPNGSHKRKVSQLECPTCKTLFIKSTGHRVYCSTRCMRAMTMKRKRGNYYNRACKTCGNDFLARGPTTLYCANSRCQAVRRRNETRYRKRHSPSYLRGAVVLNKRKLHERRHSTD